MTGKTPTSVLSVNFLFLSLSFFMLFTYIRKNLWRWLEEIKLVCQDHVVIFFDTFKLKTKWAIRMQFYTFIFIFACESCIYIDLEYFDNFWTEAFKLWKLWNTLAKRTGGCISGGCNLPSPWPFPDRSHDSLFTRFSLSNLTIRFALLRFLLLVLRILNTKHLD